MRFLVFLLLIGAAAGGFYGGMYYQKNQSLLWGQLGAAPTPTPTPAPVDARAEFQTRRAAVDANPQKWIDENLPLQLSKEAVANASDLKDPEFLYFYGRALMLTGMHREAMAAFESALNNVRATPDAKLSLEAETRIATAAAALQLKKNDATLSLQDALVAEEKALRVLEDAINLKVQTPAP